MPKGIARSRAPGQNCLLSIEPRAQALPERNALATLLPHLLRLPVTLLALARLAYEPTDQRPLRQVAPEPTPCCQVKGNIMTCTEVNRAAGVHGGEDCAIEDRDGIPGRAHAE